MVGYIKHQMLRTYDWAGREYPNNVIAKSIIWLVLKRRSYRVSRSIDDRLRARGIGLTPGGIVLDIGANVGAVSEFFLQKQMIVHAYEPNPFCCLMLNQRLRRYADFSLHEVAVAAKTETRRMYMLENYHGNPVERSVGVTLIRDKKKYVPGSDELIVNCVAIEEVLDAFDRIDIIKIDIEGFEYQIYEPILARMDRIGCVLMETHERISALKPSHDLMLTRIRQAGVEERFFTDWI